MPFNATTIGTSTTGTFAGGTFIDTFDITGSEVNMIALNLTEGQFYEIDVDNGVSGDLYMRIFDQFGVEVRANDDGFLANDNTVFSLSPYLRFTPNYTGVYYVAISAWYLDSYDPFTTAGRVGGENPLALTAGTLTVTDIGSGVWGSSGSINAIVAEGSSDLTDMLRDTDGAMRVELTGFIDSLSDVDMSRIDLNKGDVVVIDVNGTLPTGTIGTVLRVFDDNGVQIGFDDDSGFGEDPELIFNVPILDDYYIGITAEGNSAYTALDGTGTINGVATGGYEVIIHRNPTQIGSSISNSFTGDESANYIVSLSGNDTVSGGDGQDTLAGGDDQDGLSGGNGRDQLYGEHGNDTLNGGTGRDVLSGGLGVDLLNGQSGDDLLDGGDGNDNLFGSTGLDTLRGNVGNDTLNGGTENDLLLGESDQDFLFGGAGNDTLDGGSGNDVLNASTEDDALFGGTGNDTLNGGAGVDMLSGGDGNDLLLGTGGNDRLLGDLGNDTLTGGGNDDAFVFTATTQGVDTISDFNLASADVIDLEALFGAGVVNAGNLNQFIQTSTSGISDSFLAVDANGLTGGLSFTIIAQVNGVTAAQLFDITNFGL